MRSLTLLAILFVLAGCSMPSLSIPSLTPQSQKSEDCSTASAGALEKQDVKHLSFDAQAVTESGQVSAGQPIGYTFDAKAGQQFDFQTSDRICVQLYTPSTQLLNGKELPETGKYTVQVFIPQGSTSFNLKMSLGSLLASAPSSSPSQPTASSPPPSSSPEPAASSPPPSRSPQSTAPSPQSAAKPAAPQSSNAPESTEQALDDMTDKIFYERHPGVRGRKIQDMDSELGREWEQIRQCEAIVDYTFHQRHPELNGRNIRRSEQDLTNEWLSIRSSVSGC
jgi:hypothetical protein